MYTYNAAITFWEDKNNKLFACFTEKSVIRLNFLSSVTINIKNPIAIENQFINNHNSDHLEKNEIMLLFYIDSFNNIIFAAYTSSNDIIYRFIFDSYSIFNVHCDRW